MRELDPSELLQAPSSVAPGVSSYVERAPDHAPLPFEAPKPRVYLAENFTGRTEIEELFEVRDEPDGVDAIISFRSTKVDAAMLERAGPACRLVAHYATGIDSIDLAAAKSKGVMVASTPNISTGVVAEHAVGLMLALMRHVVAGDRMVRGGDPRAFAQGTFMGRSLNGSTVGIVGRGEIGSAVGVIVEAHGATAVYAGRGELTSMLDEHHVDVLSLHCPLDDESRHLIDGAVLARLEPTTYLVNVARGAVVDERALLIALEERLIAGAALDVFEFEPRVPERFLRLDNVVMTPHLGASTLEMHAAKTALVLAELRNVLLLDLPPINRVC
jgi:lactate dehydrogenase-like 2-hydroxyacid dehydrogenase